MYDRFLSHAYDEGCRVSEVLHRGEVAQADIEQLRPRHLREYVGLLVERANQWVTGRLRIPKQQRAEPIRELRPA
jgi:hypothetical protein